METENRRRPTSGALRRLIALSLVVAVALPLVSFACLFPQIDNMPTWDQWHLIELWIARYEGRSVLPVLFKPYNGHLNVVPRSIMYVLGVLSRWDVRLDVIASYVAACGTLALLLGLLARRGSRDLWLAAPVSGQVFSFLQCENFLSGYPFGQNLSQLLATLSIVLLTLPRLGTWVFLGAAAATFASTFSWGAGLTGWYVGLVALVMRPDRSRRRIAVWLGLTLLATLAVKVGAGHSFGVIAWKQIPLFFFALLGSAATPVPFPRLDLALALGMVLFPLFAILAVWAWRRVGFASSPWLLLGLSALASAGLIAIGRSSTGLQQALASHYVTATYPLVVSCLMLAVLLAQSSTAGRSPLSSAAGQGLVLAAATVVFLQPLVISYRMLPILRSWAAVIHHNAVDIARGTASDVTIQRSHHPHPSLVRGSIAIMREHQLSWFNEANDEGPPWGRVERVAGQTIDARTFTIPVGEPWTAEGWAVRSREEGGEVKGIYLYVDGRRIAAAQLDLPRSDVEEYFGSPRFLDSGWSLSIPADAVPEGIHHLWLVAADYNDGLFTLLEGRLVARRAAAAGEPARASGGAGAGRTKDAGR
jgi:hypothetical protein